MTRRTVILANVAALALVASGATAVHADADSVAPKAPSYAQRNIDADFVATIGPRAILTLENACPFAAGIGYAFTETQTYRANGGAMGRQHFNQDTLKVWWNYPGTKRRVTFNGLTFENHTGHRVMVAGWCG